MSRPFISVLIDTYNHERFIEQAIRSALEQDFPVADREILIVDDGSTDKTPEILRQFEPGIRILQKTNGGQASAFNRGIPECRGEIIAFLDGDDWWAANKLSCIVAAFAAKSRSGYGGPRHFGDFPRRRCSNDRAGSRATAARFLCGRSSIPVT